MPRAQNGFMDAGLFEARRREDGRDDCGRCRVRARLTGGGPGRRQGDDDDVDDDDARRAGVRMMLLREGRGGGGEAVRRGR